MLDDVLANIRWQLQHPSAGCVTLSREQGERLLQFAEHNTHAFKVGKHYSEEVQIGANGMHFGPWNDARH